MSRLAGLFLNEPPAAETAETVPQQYTLLLVDDEPNVLKALRRIFRQENYRILLAHNAEEALQVFAEARTVHLVISDHRMPGGSGADLLKKIKQSHPDTIRIMLTGHADVQAVMGAVNEGAVYKFITKPWNDEDLRVTVGLALEQYDLIQENRRLKREGGEKEREIRGLKKFARVSRSQLGRLLVKRALVDPVQMQEAQRQQRKSHEPLSTVLLRRELVSEQQLCQVLQKELKLECVALAEWQISPDMLSLLPRSLCEEALVLPLRMDGKRLMLAMVDPSDFYRVDDLSFLTGLEIQPLLVAESDLRSKICERFGEDGTGEQLADLMAEYDPLDAVEIVIEEDDEEDIESLLRSKDHPPAIRVVNAILSEAVRLDASDVHIEPRTKHVAVRYRIDGMLTDKIQVPPSIHLALVSRLKILADLDIAERRRPQDGRITVKTSRRVVDLRISTMPTIQGEKIVLRILDRNSSVKSFSDLGLEGETAAVLHRLARTPQGIVLATGPTGSGKTTTLYSLIGESFDPSKNYVTIEDPVEYYLEQAGQVHIREKIGLDFPTVLRAVLRQDPDVILLGEVRDLETARVAFHAALTGHLVLSTLHTNSAAATVVRLRDLGMDGAVIGSALRGILAQRLVRCLCPRCVTQGAPDPELLADLGLEKGWGDAAAGQATGCDACHGTGYHGRVALFEILEMTDPLREVIRAGAEEREIRETAREWGFRTLLDDGAGKVQAGRTSLEELMRVLGPQQTTTRPCPSCAAPVEPRHRACPGCGATVVASCCHCGTPWEEAWRFCGSCGLAGC